MADPNPSDPMRLPPDLAELDREFSALRIEERASFGPELIAELANAYERPAERRTTSPFTRALVAAGIALILLGSFTVPPARATLARFLVRVQAEATSVLRFSATDLPDPTIRVDQPEPVTPGVFASTVDPIPEPRIVRLGVDPADVPVPAITFPELQNRAEVEELVQSLYPQDLQDDRVGGDVRLLLWVDSAGSVEEAQVGVTSGLAALDRAALATAPYLTFKPANRQGIAVGSWVQFDVRFEPLVEDTEDALPRVNPVSQPAAPEMSPPELVPEWMFTEDPLSAPDAGEAEIELLREAMGDGRAVEERWGSLEDLMAGEPPATALPLRWRNEAAAALEDAILRDPGNPAPFLALGRIRKRQGLPVDARRLFERGIDRAEAASNVVPSAVVADLYYEHGNLVSEDWLPWLNLGQVHSMTLATRRCPSANSREPTRTHASSGTLIAWNYLCPREFDFVMREGFESLEVLKHAVRDDMTRSYMAAVATSAGHVAANVEILLEQADAGSFDQLLAQAQTFALASSGDPQALLLTGLALHRLGRSPEAQTQFGLALQRLRPDVVQDLRDLSPLMGRGAPAIPAIGTRERAEMERRFWSSLDPLLATPVNEREIEHLARATYAHLRFGRASSDAGRVWVRYGRPNRVRTVRDGAGLRTVFWDYGAGPDITFRRPAGTLSLELTSEGRAYVEELLDVFPHRYDAGRGRLLSIVSQTARFRSDDGLGVEIEVHAEVPAELATGPADSLDVGLYLVGPGGERWVVTRRRVPAVVAPLHLSAEPTTTSDRVVLELFHTTSNKAARLEIPVTRDARKDQVARVSELLFVEPVSPYSPVDAHRRSSMVNARTSPSFRRGSKGGVVFEIYDLPDAAGRYGLEVSAEDLASGERYRVPLKPAGELEFRSRWDRSRRSSPTLSEYVTLDLSSLHDGAYLVRMLLDVSGDGQVLESSRVVEIR